MDGNETNFEVMIEIPKGSRNKYEYRKETGQIVFDRMLYASVHYPGDYGFIPDTLALDGDELDVLVLINEPTFPGCIINARPIGVFMMEDDKGPDEKVLCVPVSDPLWNHIYSLKQLPPHLLIEIEHFFSIYKDLEQKKVKVDGWRDKDSAVHIIEQARARCKHKPNHA